MNAAPLPLRKLLIATDFSEPAERALRCAEQLSAACATPRLVLAHALDDGEYLTAVSLGLGGDLSQVAAMQSRLRSEETGRLRALADASKGRGFDCETRLLEGSPSAQVTLLAEELPADAIVLSTHGRTGWRRFVLGSVAELIIRYAPCPILAIHSHDVAAPASAATEGLAAPPLQLRRLLVATDFSHRSAAALQWGESLARAANASITLVHVARPVQFPPATFGESPLLSAPADEEIVQAVRRALSLRLEELCAGLQKRGVPAEPLLLIGSAAERINDAARTSHCDLIVLGRHGASGWPRALLGGHAERIVRAAPCPVWIA